MRLSWHANALVSNFMSNKLIVYTVSSTLKDTIENRSSHQPALPVRSCASFGGRSAVIGIDSQLNFPCFDTDETIRKRYHDMVTREISIDQ